jgi:succinate-acetate transporter protein
LTNTSLSNPAAVGFAGFGGTTLLLQFHNLGFSGVSGGAEGSRTPDLLTAS